MTVPRLSRLIIAAAGPPVILAIIEMVMLVLSLTGDHPRWRVQSVNVSEAAAIRDFAEVARLIERGENPDDPRLVRQGLIDGRAHRLTPLEAATIAKRDEIVAYLFDHGARPTPGEWLRIRCHAEASGSDDVLEILDTVRPVAVAETCDGVLPLL